MVGCDAPPEEGSAAFRAIDAQEVEDDEQQPQGSPNDMCDDCGSYWLADRGHVGIYLEEDVGAGVLPLNDTAHIFFKGAERGLKFEVTARFDHDFDLYVIKVPRRYLRPPALQRQHSLPGFGKEEAVLRLENDKASVDVRLHRFYGHNGGIVDETGPVAE